MATVESLHRTAWNRQAERNRNLIENSRYMRPEVVSEVLPFTLHPGRDQALSEEQVLIANGLGTEAARIALASLASLAKIGELDHLGGGLDLIPAFTLTVAMTDYDKIQYTIEHAHTSIGYFSTLAAYGFLDRELVIDGFRRGLDIPGHVSWVPGGTELNGGRLGVMIPAAVGCALGMKARLGEGTFMICHCGDAGWISGQALNGFNAAHLHRAPITFVMHRNGIQLSGANKAIMDKDPRPIIASLGVTILEIPTFTDTASLYQAYVEAYRLAQEGKPTLIYPTGFKSKSRTKVTLRRLGRMYRITRQVEEFAARHGVDPETEIWIPGSLMSYRDVVPMLECIFLVNGLPGGEGHHDGHMKGRDLRAVLANPMFKESKAQKEALAHLEGQPKRRVVTTARPAPGSPNLILPDSALAEVELPPVGKSVSPRAGSEAAYAAIAKAFPSDMFVVSCDLDPSTKLGKARKFLPRDHQFEMSIEEQASSIMANGLAVSSRRPQLNVFSTFAAFYEGIAREGFEMWRYQRNLTGVNEGLNVVMHLSHVGACTGRDHFSGWSLDWVNLGISYLPYLHRLYAPADARAAFVAVRDMAAHYGGHIICIPRDNLPILAKVDGGPLWTAQSRWEPVTEYRVTPGARRAILAFGAPAFLAGQAVETLAKEGVPTDAYVVNGLPLPEGTLEELAERYPEGLATIEDGIISGPGAGIVGFAGLVRSAVEGRAPLEHVGIVDPRIAPSEGHLETWAHFGLTADALVEAVSSL
ncbi:hypothetical protein HS125_01045 [bacterium]|nr:hypothetical protein [bacterium]